MGSSSCPQLGVGAGASVGVEVGTADVPQDKTGRSPSLFFLSRCPSLRFLLTLEPARRGPDGTRKVEGLSQMKDGEFWSV